jgi:ADP-heptose:LPS heptosyltransferase/lauroyl/myristoyl acyltransferase
MPGRRRILLSNLDHAFPERCEKWRSKIARESFIRMIELGLLAVACGHLSKKRIFNNFKASASLVGTINNIINSKRGALILVSHLSTMEATSFVPVLTGVNGLEIGALYRPFGSKTLEKFIKLSRERFGIKMLSRKLGSVGAMKILGRNGVVALFFDQNAGCSGYTTTFFDRCAQTTKLPGLLAAKYNVPVYCLYQKRIGTWRAEIEIEKLCQACQKPAELAITANGWLERKLRASDDACADWLWAHDRWKFTFSRPNIFSIENSRSWLSETKQLLNYKTFPKKMRIFIRMPNWLGDVVMAIPVIRALKISRPDIELTMICQPRFVEFLDKLNLAERFIELPEKGFWYLFHLLKYRKLYPDIHVLLTHSLRSDLEARVIGATVRLGMGLGGRRPLLTDVFQPGQTFDWSSNHQTKMLTMFFRYYGLKGGINYTPYKICLESNLGRQEHSIGIICGSSNNPAKRWPIDCWRTLIERIVYRYQDIRIKMYGTEADAQIADKIGLGRHNIQQLCGKTTLVELGKSIQFDDLVISADTGGMHVANMFGRPVVCIYGPTNSVRNGPIFNAKRTILYPDGCSSKGGFPVADVTVDQVISAVASTMDSVVAVVRE